MHTTCMSAWLLVKHVLSCCCCCRRDLEKIEVSVSLYLCSWCLLLQSYVLPTQAWSLSPLTLLPVACHARSGSCATSQGPYVEGGKTPIIGIFCSQVGWRTSLLSGRAIEWLVRQLVSPAPKLTKNHQKSSIRITMFKSSLRTRFFLKSSLRTRFFLKSSLRKRFFLKSSLRTRFFLKSSIVTWFFFQKQHRYMIFFPKSSLVRWFTLHKAARLMLFF